MDANKIGEILYFRLPTVLNTSRRMHCAPTELNCVIGNFQGGRDFSSFHGDISRLVRRIIVLGELGSVVRLRSGAVMRVRLLGVSNGSLKLSSTRKIWPLLDWLAKFKRVLACSYSHNFAIARMLGFTLKIARNYVNRAL